MATSASFDLVCDELELHTNLDRMHCRGTVRLALKEAGLDPARVQPREMRVVLERLLPERLQICGVDAVGLLCERIARGVASLATVPQPDSPDTIFGRLGG